MMLLSCEQLGNELLNAARVQKMICNGLRGSGWGKPDDVLRVNELRTKRESQLVYAIHIYPAI